jgi:hypothetical protein
MVIPFRQTEFKAALLKWIILNNIKYRKVTSGRLASLFKIANVQAVPANPLLHTTLHTWIYNMY